MTAIGPTWARRLVCSATGVTADIDHPTFLSPASAPWLVEYELDAARGAAWKESLAERPWTLWRYRELLPVIDFESRVDLGEGGTPIIPLHRMRPEGIEVWLKEEGGNPTGSFKARGLSMAVNRARELGATGVQLPSAGNAAIALAAYAAAAGLPARVAVPTDTPAEVVRRCRLHGAEVFTGGETLVESAAKLAELGGDYWNLSTLKEPYRVEGKKTMGLELAEQFNWQLPDWIIYPTGGGTGIVGMHKAFAELEALGLLSGPRPHFAVVQMNGCAPIVKAFEAGAKKAETWENPDTRVWGLRVPKAIGDFLILDALRETDGAAVAVAEQEVEELQARVGREEGLLVGPEGAAALAALYWLAADGKIQAGQRVVVFQT
ncbi:MAG: threonine synthase, partial [Thermoanaerobaculia bacterium]